MNRALIIVAHGSSVKPSTADTVLDASRELGLRTDIRDRFDTVRACFLKQAPFLEKLDWEAFDEVVVVPFFMADGYFVQTVLPRHIPSSAKLTSPLGTADLAEIIAREVQAFDPEAHLVLVGHGTTRNPGSAASVEDDATRLRALVRSVTTAFVDQEPRLETTWDRVPRDGHPVLVLPYFAFPGPHTKDDIPSGLGLTNLDGGPNDIDGLRVHYAAPIGTVAGVVEVLAALALG